jgi:hypothetical protein
MSKEETPLDDLDQFVPRPEGGVAKRHMLAVEPDAYKFITETADKLKTTRGRVVTALVSFYRDGE